MHFPARAQASVLRAAAGASRRRAHARRGGPPARRPSGRSQTRIVWPRFESTWEQPYPCSKPLRSDKVSAGGREAPGPGSRTQREKRGDKGVASRREESHLGPGGHRERGKDSRSSKSLTITFALEGWRHRPRQETQGDVFRGEMITCRATATQTSGGQTDAG